MHCGSSSFDGTLDVLLMEKGLRYRYRLFLSIVKPSVYFTNEVKPGKSANTSELTQFTC
jgi:hypothetical protein